MNATHQKKLVLYKESDPNYMQMAWANYDEDGYFINITNFYGATLKVSNENKVYINNQTWIIKESLKRFY